MVFQKMIGRKMDSFTLYTKACIQRYRDNEWIVLVKGKDYILKKVVFFFFCFLLKNTIIDLRVHRPYWSLHLLPKRKLASQCKK